MSINFEEYISSKYPQLSDTAFLDYNFTAPISTSQIQKIKSLSQKLIPSPHSSEEQSDFDRTISLLRSKIAELFSTNLINYSVILFQNREAAIDEIFESFPWNNGSHYIIHPNFDKNIKLLESTFNFAHASGANQILKESKDFTKDIKYVTKSGAHSLLLTSFYDNQKSLDISKQYLKQGFGVHHVLFDATSAAPFHYPNLSTNSFDFVLLSFKKICGIDLCALLVKLQSAEQLKPQFYGGGAVAFSCARSLVHRNFKSHTKRFENGTPLLLSIFASYEGLVDLTKFVNSEITFSEESTANLSEKIDQLMTKMVDQINQLQQNIKCEIDQWAKKVTINFEDEKFADAKMMQVKYIENRVIVGVNANNQIFASFGFGVRDSDVDHFIEATKNILSL